MKLDKDNWACDNCNCVIQKPFIVNGDEYCNNGFCYSGDTCPKCNSSGGFINSSEPHDGIVAWEKTNL